MGTATMATGLICNAASTHPLRLPFHRNESSGHSATRSAESKKNPNASGVKETNWYIHTVGTTEPGSLTGRATCLHTAAQTYLRARARRLGGHEPPQTRRLKQQKMISV